ncbi:MAG: uroporphyrinogen decarboxylase family protein [Acidobacteriota bacterium]
MRKLPRDTMTARQRIEATLRGELPDRAPIFDLIQHIPLIEHVTGEKVTPANGLDLLCRTIGERLDITRGIAAPAEERIVRHDDGFVYKQEWWTTWLIGRPFHDARGLLGYIRRNIDEIRDRRPGDMWTYAGRGNVWGHDARSPRDQFLELQEKAGENTVLFPNESPVGLDTAHIRAGLELFCYAYAEDTELVSNWLEALNWAEIQRVHETADAELSPVALVYADMADKNQLLFSPAFLRREFFPRLKRLVDAWHAHSVKVIFHSDGNLWQVLEDLRAAGVDGLNPLEPLSRMYAGDVRQAHPDWILMGGIDASQLLPFASEAEVRAAVRRTIAEAGPRGRLWIGSSTEIHPAVKLENALAMWEEVERFGYY